MLSSQHHKGRVCCHGTPQAVRSAMHHGLPRPLQPKSRPWVPSIIVTLCLIHRIRVTAVSLTHAGYITRRHSATQATSLGAFIPSKVTICIPVVHRMRLTQHHHSSVSPVRPCAGRVSTQQAMQGVCRMRIHSCKQVRRRSFWGPHSCSTYLATGTY